VTPGRRARAAGGALAASLAVSCAGGEYAGKPSIAVAGGDPIVQIEKAGQPESLFAPRLVPLSQHTDPPFRREKVVGVSLGEAARMYPLGLLDDYAAVDDEAGGVPFVVVRDPMTDLSAVLDRRAGGRTLTLEGSGAVWRGVRVLRDRETGTYWTPVTGRALSGPLAGETLALIPSAVTTAEAWRELYPSTLCLETGKLTAVSLRLRLYASSSKEGVSGRKTTDRRFPPKETVFLVASGNDALAFSAGDVREKKSVASTLDGRALTIEWDGAVRAPRAWRQVVAARQELPVLPLYWFAVLEQFPGVRTLGP
jgi:uncharacterized protein DUF3179